MNEWFAGAVDPYYVPPLLSWADDYGIHGLGVYRCTTQLFCHYNYY